MFKIAVHKFVRRLMTVLLVFVFAFGASGVRVAHAVTPSTVVAWGDNCCGESTIPPGLSDVTAIAAGDYHSLALKSDGTVVAWGYNLDGHSTVPAGLSGVTAIDVEFHGLALKSDGTVVAWGANCCGQSTVPAGLGDGPVTARIMPHLRAAWLRLAPLC
jgi:hypothetical protein